MFTFLIDEFFFGKFVRYYQTGLAKGIHRSGLVPKEERSPTLRCSSPVCYLLLKVCNTTIEKLTLSFNSLLLFHSCLHFNWCHFKLLVVMVPFPTMMSCVQ